MFYPGNLIRTAQALGWHVGPLQGKVPLTARGHQDFSDNPDALAAFAGLPLTGMGVSLEPSGLLVVDCDSEEARLEAEALGLPPTATAATGKGFHYYYRLPAGAPAARRTRWGESGKIDLLSKGFTVLPPSAHPSGRIYEWITPPDAFVAVGELELPDAPAWTVAALREGGEQPIVRGAVSPNASGEPPVELIGRDLALWEAGYQADTDRSEHEWKLACALARAGLTDEQELAGVLLGYDARQARSRYAGRRDGATRTLTTARRAITQTEGEGVVVMDPVEDEPGPVDLSPAAPPKKRAPGVGQAEWRDRYLAAFPYTAYGQGSWRRYDGGIWREITDQQVGRELAGLMGDKATSNTISAVMRLVKDERAIEDERWDSNGDILVCANGTLELPAGELREHRPGDYATKHPYDPDAECPMFDRYLATSLAKVGPKVPEFFLEFGGLCLTTWTDFEITLWFVGQPGNGKSTGLTALETALGNDRKTGLAGVLSLKDISQSRFALTKLPGRRLLTAAEQPTGYMDCSDTLNAIVSGDTINVEAKFKEAYDFRSVAKVAWAMNEPPRLSSAADGLFRRVQILELLPMSKAERDPAVKRGILGEGPGILAKLVQALRRLVARGDFDYPPEVVRANEEFQRSNDVASLFVEERCATGGRLRVRGGAIYEAYRNWCDSNGYKPKNSRNVAEDWRRLGFAHKTINGRGYWIGVDLRHTEQAEQAA